MWSVPAALCYAMLSFGRLGTSIDDIDIVRQKIDESPLVVFGAAYCPFCRRVEDSLARAGLEHSSHDISSAERTALRSLTGQRTIPYVFVRGTFIGGCNDGPEPWQGTLPLLHSGKLQTMLQPKALPPPPLPPSALATPIAYHSVVIIGSGVAALTAAIYLGRSDRSPLVLTGPDATSGGQLMLTARVDNFPGFPAGISGRELMRRLEEQAINAGAHLLHEHVISVERSPTVDHTTAPAAAAASLSEREPFVLRTASGRNVTARALVVASGGYVCMCVCVCVCVCIHTYICMHARSWSSRACMHA